MRRQMRLRYASCAHLHVYLPRFKGAARDGAVSRARVSGQLERGVEPLPGASSAGEFDVEAKAYGFAGRERVLAVARLR